MVSSAFYLVTTKPPLASDGLGGAAPSPSGTKSTDAVASSSAVPIDDVEVHMRPAPRPPPRVDKSQLKTWHAALEWRNRQVHSLKRQYLISFANEIVADLVSTRYKPNECSTDVEGDTNDRADIESYRSGYRRGVDLVDGLYSSYLLTQQPVSNADEGNVANLLVGLKKSAPALDASDAGADTISTPDKCKQHDQKQEATLAKSNADERDDSSALKVGKVRAVAVPVTRKRKPAITIPPVVIFVWKHPILQCTSKAQLPYGKRASYFPSRLSITSMRG